jgi:hypothetical protein
MTVRKKQPARRETRPNSSEGTPPSGHRMRRFLAPELLIAGVSEIVAIAARARVTVLLVGGLAMQHYGSDRLTGDLDFAARKVPKVLPMLGTLSFGGVQTSTACGVPVNFIVRGDDYADLYQEAILASPVVTELGVRVVLPEYLAAMKMAAGRDKDFLDLKFLLSQEGLVDAAKARVIVRKHLGPYAAREFDSLVDEAAWQKSRGR